MADKKKKKFFISDWITGAVVIWLIFWLVSQLGLERMKQIVIFSAILFLIWLVLIGSSFMFIGVREELKNKPEKKPGTSTKTDPALITPAKPKRHRPTPGQGTYAGPPPWHQA